MIAPHPRVKKFCEMTGWTEKAVSRKREEGVWIEGREYHKAPDGSIVIDILGYNKWASSRSAPRIE
jgi:hypothetical protein